jgi:pyruvate formate lyase activating enzyme
MNKREFLRCSGGVVLGCLGLPCQVKGWRDPEVIGQDDLPGPWSKEAKYTVQVDGAVQCLKCPHECVLTPGMTGLCRNRVNVRGKVYSTAYGNPCAVHVDPIEKKPLFHFLPSTRAFSIAVAGCNMRCLNCQNWQISQVSPTETVNENLPPVRVVEECVRSGAESIAYTYSEPTTFYEYAYDTARIARERGIRNVWKSNGYIREQPLRDLCRYLDAANIDLKGFDEDIYWRLNGGHLEPVLRSLKVLKDEGVWLEITHLLIPEWTDVPETFRRMCDWLVKAGLRDCPLHVTRFVPQYRLQRVPPTPVDRLEQARAVARDSGVRYVYIGNVPGHPAEHTYCAACGKQILERRGFTILSRHMKENRCAFCGQMVPGVWTTKGS